ncbi:hypothetical protein H2248_011515 [Termitomyces sp. 'cryptogamus']|nr:hypothetical protein H2248_011515 [Termitomyces sp. 'cryptogamus']
MGRFLSLLSAEQLVSWISSSTSKRPNVKGNPFPPFEIVLTVPSNLEINTWILGTVLMGGVHHNHIDTLDAMATILRLLKLENLLSLSQDDLNVRDGPSTYAL